MTDTLSAARRSRPTHVVFALFLGLALYILSVGPADRLHARGAFGDWDDTIALAYTPLVFVYERVPLIRPPIDAWIALWHRLL